MKKVFTICLILAVAASLLLVAGGCRKTASSQQNTTKKVVTVGSKNFTEQLILGEMIAQLMEGQGIPVERKLNISGIMLIHEALVRGDIDIYPEYDGTGLTYILKEKPIFDSAAILKAVQQGYKQQFNLIWLNQAPMSDGNIFVTRPEIAAKYHLTDLSDLAKQAPNLTVAVPAEFVDRPDGLPLMKASYGGFNFKEVKIVDAGIRYQGLLDKDYDVTLGFGTDGQIAGYNLVPLPDDKNIWPPYHVGAVLRPWVLQTYPQLEAPLNRLFSLITNQTMMTLNWDVDGPSKMEPAAVAQNFLKSNGFIIKQQ
jgi:osmoprotectant transport system substrate-binding protein